MTETGKHVSEMMEDYEKGSIRSGSTGQRGSFLHSLFRDALVQDAR